MLLAARTAARGRVAAAAAAAGGGSRRARWRLPATRRAAPGERPAAHEGLSKFYARAEAAGVRDYYTGAREKAFEELGLEADGHYDAAGGIRTRQHANPLLSRYQVVPDAPDWSAIYDDPTRPLVLDVGCGPGRFVLLAAQRGGCGDLASAADAPNFLGLEIREKLPERARKWAAQLGHAGRCHFVATNATVSVGALLASYPGPLRLACVQFPDPHFKKRHHKRRVVQRSLVEAVCDKLEDGGAVWLQSDVEAVARDMLVRFVAHGARGGAALRRAPAALEERATGEMVPSGDRWQAVEAEYADLAEEAAAKEIQLWPWMVDNPLGVPTEREVLVGAEGEPVFRMLLEKARAPPEDHESA